MRRTGYETLTTLWGVNREGVGTESSIARVRQPYGFLWPDGTFSLSYRFATEADAVAVPDEWAFLGGGFSGCPSGGRDPHPANFIQSQESSQGIIGTGRIQKKSGLKGITNYGRKMVRSAAALLDKIYGPSELCFLTFTVPPLPLEGRRSLAENWGELVRQFQQYLSRRLKSAGRPALLTGVTELQSKRHEGSGQAYLHCHYVFPVRSADGKDYVVDVDDFRSWLRDAVERFSGVDVTTLPRVEAKVLRKSAGRYLSKYLTKGAGDMSRIVDDLGESAVPGQQWGMSGPMRDMVKAACTEGFRLGAWLQTLADEVANGGSVPGFWALIRVDVGGRELTVGWAGSIPDENREELLLPTIDRRGIISINRDFSMSWYDE